MAIIAMPASVRISRIEWSLDRPAQANESGWTGKTTVVANPWHGKWRARVELAPIVGEANVRAWRAFLTLLKGQINSFLLPATEGAQHAGLSPLIGANAAQGATSATLAGPPELVTNGTFGTDASGWTTVGATVSVVGGAMRVTNSGAAAGYAYQSMPTVVGRTYTAQWDAITGTGQANLRVATTALGTTYNNSFAAVGGSVTFVATTTATVITCRVNSSVSGAYADFDNISLKLSDVGPVPALTAGMSVTFPLPSGNYQMVMLTADITSNVITFQPPLREAVSANGSIETRNPYAQVALADSAFGWSVDAGQRYDLSFAVAERF